MRDIITQILDYKILGNSAQNWFLTITSYIIISILLGIIKAFEAENIKFAYPTQMIYHQNSA